MITHFPPEPNGYSCYRLGYVIGPLVDRKIRRALTCHDDTT